MRAETNADIEAIPEVTLAAFKYPGISHHSEQFIIHALRKAHALTISPVAEMDGQGVGRIAFSPVTISAASTSGFRLGPASVLPKHQKKRSGNPLSIRDYPELKSQKAWAAFFGAIRHTISDLVLRIFRSWFIREPQKEDSFAMPFIQQAPKGMVLSHEGFLAES